MINFLLTTPEPVFLKSVCRGKEKETGKFLANLLFELMDEIKSKGVSKTKFFILITDNDSKMRAAWAIFNENTLILCVLVVQLIL